MKPPAPHTRAFFIKSFQDVEEYRRGLTKHTARNLQRQLSGARDALFSREPTKAGQLQKEEKQEFRYDLKISPPQPPGFLNEPEQPFKGGRLDPPRSNVNRSGVIVESEFV